MKRKIAIVISSLVACVVALLIIDACTIVNGLIVESEASTMTMNGDAGDATADGPVDPCTHAFPPAPPALDPSVLDDGAEVFAVVARNVSFGFETDGGLEPIGFDLDKTCSCFPGPDTCKSLSGMRNCDTGGGGQDNAAQGLLQKARDIGKLDFEKATNQSVNAGGRSILVWVSGYNGNKDDKKVQVAVLVSPGLFTPSTDDVLTPTFTSQDKWSVDMSSAIAGQATIPSRLVDGYVTNHTVVVRALDIALPITQLAVVSLAQAVFVAEIIDLPGGGHSLGALHFGGRWSITEAARVLGSFEPKVDAGHICDLPDQTIYKFLKAGICQAADIRTAPKDDGQGMNCDALSVAVRAQGAPATLGEVRAIDTTGYCTTTPPLDCLADGGP